MANPAPAVAVLDYGAGNLTSVGHALAHLGCREAVITSDPAVVAAADKVIFPGVGAAGQCMAGLHASGLDCALRSAVVAGTPVLGICVGMQLLFDWSEEDGGVECLGLLPGSVVRLHPPAPAPGAAALKVPHMGWNELRFCADDALLAGLPPRAEVYFVHSYHCLPGPGVTTIAVTDHGGDVCAVVRRGNLAAVQFHPEKSGAFGLRLLKNFLVA